MTVAAGDFLKGAGVVVGTSLVLIAVGVQDTLFTLGCLLLAAAAGVLFFALGLLVAAQGQTLRASLDSAVNSFPALTEAEKSQVMKL